MSLAVARKREIVVVGAQVCGSDIEGHLHTDGEVGRAGEGGGWREGGAGGVMRSRERVGGRKNGRGRVGQGEWGRGGRVSGWGMRRRERME